MAALYLVRHGQASFGAADYDQLSPLGAEQSHILGKHWQKLPTIDNFYGGDLLRHSQTAEHFFAGLQKSSPVICHSGFNEFDHVDVLCRFDTNWQKLTQKHLISEQDKAQANKIFEQAFTKAMQRWVSGQFDDEYKESFCQFKSRCLQALQDVIKQHQVGKNTLVFTSGGPITMIIQHILGLNNQQILKINQQLANTSVSKILFSQQRLSIDYINNYSHIEMSGAERLTYR